MLVARSVNRALGHAARVNYFSSNILGVSRRSTSHGTAPTKHLLYRGVPSFHVHFRQARSGVVPGSLSAAKSRSVDTLISAAEVHNQGSEAARDANGEIQEYNFTSWTKSRAIAATHAGLGGVVLDGLIGPPENNLVWSPDHFNEHEVLVEGAVLGLNVTIVRRLPLPPLPTSSQSSQQTKASKEDADSHVPSRALSLFRALVRQARLLPVSGSFPRASSLAQIRSEFQKSLNERDEQKKSEMLKEAEAKLAFLRMITPKQRTRSSHTQQQRSDTTRLVYDAEGNILADVDPLSEKEKRSKPPGYRDNRVTDDQIRRHHALLDRMQFKGPFWAGKR